MRFSTRFNCFRFTNDSNLRTPRADRCVISMCSGTSGWLSMNHCIRRSNPGSRSTISGSSVSTANSGINPTIDRTFKK